MDKLLRLAISFVNEHWNEFNTDDLGLPKSKSAFIKELKIDKQSVAWVLTEAMSWVCKENYLKPYIIENKDFLVIKVDDSYFKLMFENGIFEEVFPKTKTVIYFE